MTFIKQSFVLSCLLSGIALANASGSCDMNQQDHCSMHGDMSGKHAEMSGKHCSMHGDMSSEHCSMHSAVLSQSPFQPAHQRMMDDMHSVALTGDADWDFVAGMIPHHQGAVDMANALLDNQPNPELSTLAEAIIRAQEAEITFLRDWLASNAAKPSEQARDIRLAYQRINERMMQLPKLSGDASQDFLAMMIPHHEGAVEMAMVLLAFGQDEALQPLAQQVISSQNQEIEQMRGWLHPTADSDNPHSGH